MNICIAGLNRRAGYATVIEVVANSNLAAICRINLTARDASN